MVLAIGLSMLRLALVMVLMAAGLLVVAGIGGTIGTAIFLLAFSRHFKPSEDISHDCEENWRTCMSLPNDFPELPMVEQICGVGVCDYIRALGRKDLLRVIGVCVTLSANTSGPPVMPWMTGKPQGVVEFAGTYCELEDRDGRYARLATFAVMGGVGISNGASLTLGAFLGFFPMRTVDDAGGIGAEFDASAIQLFGVDFGFSGSYTGLSTTASVGGGMEQSVTGGLSFTLYHEQISEPGALGAPLALLARLAWGEDVNSGP